MFLFTPRTILKKSLILKSLLARVTLLRARTTNLVGEDSCCREGIVHSRGGCSRARSVRRQSPKALFNQLKPPKLQFAYFLLACFFCCCLLLLRRLFSIIRSLLMMLIRSRTHSSNSSLFVRATLLQKEDLSSYKSPDHNDLCSHATSKVDIDDISSILNFFCNSLLRDDLLINFLVSVFTPYKNLRSVPLSLHITCFSTISQHAPPFSNASLNKRHNGKGGVFSSAATLVFLFRRVFIRRGHFSSKVDR